MLKACQVGLGFRVFASKEKFSPCQMIKFLTHNQSPTHNNPFVSISRGFILEGACNQGGLKLRIILLRGFLTEAAY